MVVRISTVHTHQKMLQCFSPLCNHTFFILVYFLTNCWTFFNFSQKKERRDGGLSIRDSNSEWSPCSHFGVGAPLCPTVFLILPTPLWIGPFRNLEKIAHKLEGIHPKGAGVSVLYAVTHSGVRSFFGFYLRFLHSTSTASTGLQQVFQLQVWSHDEVQQGWPRPRAPVVKLFFGVSAVFPAIPSHCIW